MPLRVVFFGTPAFAVPTLERLIASSHQVVGVVTQPDRPRGRGHRLAASEVKACALAHAVPVFQPTRLKDGTAAAWLQALAPDLGVVAAYGRLLPQALLDLPRLGMINVHASLLPRWRGAAPIHRAVIAGDAETGVTIMRVVLALDAGPTLGRVVVPIGPDETSGQLEQRLAVAGARLLAETVDRLSEGPVPETVQPDAGMTYAPRLERSDSPIDWHRPALEIHNTIRGLQPWPQAAAWLAGKRLLIRRSAVDTASTNAEPAPPGTILAAHGDDLVVATAGGRLRLIELQPEGRPAQATRAFLNGHRLEVGDLFEPPPPATP
jgi:methionyl-tRNA formyltransferase